VARGYVRGDAYAEVGYGGKRIGADVATRLRVWREYLWGEGRITYAYFQDDLRPDFGGSSVGFQLGGRLLLDRGMQLHLLVEDNVSRFYASQFRVYAVLDISMLLGALGFAPGMPRGIGPQLGGFGGAYGMGY
jgi:hypothetical protein